MRAATVATCQPLVVASAQQQHPWSLPLCAPCHPRAFRMRQPALLLPPRHRFSVIRADTTGPGDTESKEVLEAFFLGKALAEAVTERLGTVVGEFLSDVGRWQAEQQKQVRDFQEEVQERARKAKVKALQEAQSAESKADSSAS